MTTQPPTGTRNRLLAALTGVLVAADILLAAIGSLAWTAYRRGTFTAAEAAAPTLLAVFAAVGAALMVATAVALIRGPRGHWLAQIAMGLAGLRLIALLVAIGVIASTLGREAVVGLTETFMIAVVCSDAAGALLVTAIAVSRTRNP